MNRIVGTHDILLMTLDTLRFDVAEQLWREGRTPHFARLLPGGWERRLTPGSFTFAAHQAFFAGFLPVKGTSFLPERLFAPRFEGSETIGSHTWVFEEPDLVRGLAASGYHTLCIGGVGFFNRRTALSSVFPNLFAESHWNEELGVTNPRSTERQFQLAARRLDETPADRRVFLFVNVSAIHQPNRWYLPGAERDCLESHGAALCYVDDCLPILVEALRRRGPVFGIICSDHGTAYGEDGLWGHRVPHPIVWTVPYAEVVLGRLQ